MKRALLCVLAATLLLATTAFATNGTRLIGFGTKMNGRGATGVGVFDSPSLMMTNPAGLTFLDAGSGLGVNLAMLTPSTSFKNSLNDKDGDKNYYPLGGLGYVSHPKKLPRLAWGAGLFTQGGMGADYELNHALFKDASGQFVPQTYHSYFGILQAGPSVAYELIPGKLSVGTTLNILYAQLEFEMPYSMSPSIMKGVVNPTTGMTFGDMFSHAPLNYDEVTSAAKMSGLEAWGFGAKLGFAYKVNEKLSLGINYTAPSPMTFKGGKADLNMDAQFHDAFTKQVVAYMQEHGVSADSAQHAVGAQFAQLGINAAVGMEAEYDLEAELTNPQTLALGIAWQASPKVLLAADFEWLNWKSGFEKMDLSLEGGENPNINRLLGSPDISVEFPLEWKDAIMVRLGSEYAASLKTTLRLGYAFGTNPVPTSTIFSIFPAIVEHHITAGASYKFSPRFEGHAAYEIALKKELDADDNNLIANEYDGSTSGLTGMLFNLGVSWKL